MLSSHNLIVTPTHYRDHHSILSLMTIFFFFFNDTATTEIYTLSLHDALPISCQSANNSTFDRCSSASHNSCWPIGRANPALRDRKSTRLNSSHSQISYAVFCLKKKKKTMTKIKETITITIYNLFNTSSTLSAR